MAVSNGPSPSEKKEKDVQGGGVNGGMPREEEGRERKVGDFPKKEGRSDKRGLGDSKKKISLKLGPGGRKSRKEFLCIEKKSFRVPKKGGGES